VPTGLKATNVEIAQARDLDIESFFVRQGRTNLHTGHVRSGCSALRLPRACLVTVCALDAVDTRAVDLLRIKIQLQLFAHDAGKEAAH
jgi:hypothetical protein